MKDTQPFGCTDGTCPLDKPICVLQECLTVEQLACVCLGEKGSETAYQCASVRTGADASVPACLTEDSLCDSAPDSCCKGLTCLRGKDADGGISLGLCKRACDTDTQCDRACCASAPGIAGSFCTDNSACVTSCRNLEETCDFQRNPCCDGLICSQSPNDVALNGCKQPCRANSECYTGCCLHYSLPDAGTSAAGLCAPSDRCK